MPFPVHHSSDSVAASRMLGHFQPRTFMNEGKADILEGLGRGRRSLLPRSVVITIAWQEMPRYMSVQNLHIFRPLNFTFLIWKSILKYLLNKQKMPTHIEYKNRYKMVYIVSPKFYLNMWLCLCIWMHLFLKY